MPTHILGTPAPRDVVVFRALPGLGDMLCLMPALRSLRAGLPDARITLLGLPAARWLVERFPRLVDELLEFPGYPGIPEVDLDSGRVANFLAQVQGRFDLALQLHGSGSNSNAFVTLLGAGRSAGVYLPSSWCPDPETFVPYPAHDHEIRRLLAPLRQLGFPDRGEAMEFPVTPRDRQVLAELLPGHETEPYVVVHPGSTDPQRRWPTERFAEVADELALSGLEVVVTGTEAERPLTKALLARLRSKAHDLTGRTGIGEMAALLEGAQLLLCNDTGVSHLAAALGTPSVVVFITTDPERWAPLDRQRHRAVGKPSPERANACLHSPEIAGHRCLRDACASLVSSGDPPLATATEVLEAAAELMSNRS